MPIVGGELGSPVLPPHRPRRYAQDRVRHVRAGQRPHRHPAPGSLQPARGGGPMVPRGIQGRIARPDGVRASVRAPDVHGLAPRAVSVVRFDHGELGRPQQRHHQQRPDELLRDRAAQPARDVPVAGGGSAGDVARRHHAGRARSPAQGRPERAPPVVREPPVRRRRAGRARGDVPARAPLPLADDRLARRRRSGDRGRRARVLRALLPALERQPVDRGRLRPGDGARAGRQVLRLAAGAAAPRTAPAPGRRRAWMPT